MPDSNKDKDKNYPAEDNSKSTSDRKDDIFREEIEKELNKSNLNINENDSDFRKDDLPRLRTYELDSASALRDKEASVVDINRAEREKRAEVKKKMKQGQNSSFQGEASVFEKSLVLNEKLLKVASVIVILLLGLGAIWFAFWYEGPEGVPLTERQTNLDEAVVINVLESDDLKNVLNSALYDDELALDEAREVILVSGTQEETIRRITAEEFLRRLNSQIPPTLLRSLQPEYLLASYQFDGRDTFLILQSDFFASAFRGMLLWEDTIIQDLLFLQPAKFLEPTGDDSTSLQLNQPLDIQREESIFRDTVVRNIDVREALINNEEILLYGFPNSDTIIIATSHEAFLEARRILSRNQ